MFFFIYDLPTWLFCILTMTVSVVIGVGGLLLTRPLMVRIGGSVNANNDIVSYFLSACGVFYGITLGLIAVGAWQSFVDVDTKVNREASALAALYRDVSSYPEPIASQLRAGLKEYTRFVIEEAWPQQQRGIVPSGGTERINAFQPLLFRFEPQTEGQKAVHAEALRQFNVLVETRRLRLAAVTAGLPTSLWVVVAIGALLNFFIMWCFRIDNLRLHATLIAIASALIGLLIFMTAAMDYPFRGEVSISPDAFRIVYEQLMK